MSRAGLLALALLLLPRPAWGGPEPGAMNDETVRQIAAQLRCVVCQNLSVADSPSEMASQMREIIHERLRAGDTPDQVVAYFVDKYGEWILLTPRPRGFNLLVWVLPFGGIAAGLVGILLMALRWSRRSRATPAIEPVDSATRERIRREISELEP